MSSNSLNDLSKVYLDRVATLNTDLSNKDIKRWENLGGPTPEDYKPTGDSAKIKSESKKVRVKEKQGFSDWRSEGFFEAITTPITDKKDLKKIKEVSGINNKVAINPRLKEAVAEMGGELLEVTDTAEKEAAEDPGLKSKEQRQKMIKKQVLLKKLQAVRAGSHQDITASYEPEIEGAVEFFYEEGINEEGLDLIIEEIGLDDFVDFVIDDSAELLNEERAARRATVRAKKYDVVKKEVDKADAARRKAKKGEYAPSYAKKETDVTVYDDKPGAKKKAPVKKPVAKKVAPKPAPKKVAPKPVAKKVVKAVAKVKPTQPKKVASKTGLRDKIRTAVKAGVKRHKKAVQPARVFAKGFKRGVTDTVKFAQKAKKAVVGEATAELELEGHKPLPKNKMWQRMMGSEYKTGEHRYSSRNRKIMGVLDKHKEDPKGEADKAKAKSKLKEATDAQLKAQEKAVFELEKKEANTNRAKAKKAREKEIDEEVGISSAAAMEKARKEAKLKAKEEAAVKKAKLKEAKVDTGSAEEKATARNLRNTPPGGNRKFDTSVFITRKPGESLDSARTRKRREAHAKKRGMKEDKAFDNVVAALRKKHGESGVLTKDSPKPKAQPRPKAKPDTRTPEQKKKDQDHANVMARYGGEANYKAGRGLGT